MNYIDRPIIIDEENYLNDPSAETASNHSPLIVATLFGKRRSGVNYNTLGFGRRDTVLACVLKIPGIPTKFNHLSIS